MVYRVLVSTRRGWQEIACRCAAARANFRDEESARRAAEEHGQRCLLFGSRMAVRVAAAELHD